MKKILFTAMAVIGAIAFTGCEQTPPAEPLPDPEITNESEIQTVAFTGGTVTYEFEANRQWTITEESCSGESTEYSVELFPKSGDAGKSTVTMIFPVNKSSMEVDFSFTITLLNDENATTDAYSKTVNIKVAAPSVTDAAGNTYKAVYLSDGNFWMAENLRYIPEGKTVSDDPASEAGIWYPYSVVEKSAVVEKDNESIVKKGYLYDLATAFGADEITADNFTSFEGTRGICPEGWHIPTRAEFIGICGYSLKDASDGAAAITDETAPFYDADMKSGSVVKCNECGWNFFPCGYVNRTASDKKGSYATVVTTAELCSIDEFIGMPTMTSFISSTGYKPISEKNIQFFVLSEMFVPKSPDGKMQAGYGNYLSGYNIRCVKDNKE